MALGFTFNGRHSSEFSLWMRSKNRQMFAGSTDVYAVIPGRDGSYLFPGGVLDKEITLECSFVATSLENLRNKEKDLIAWLYTVERQMLSFDDEPGKYYRAKLAGSIDPSQIFKLESFDLKLRCEPFAYGDQVITNFANDTVTLTNAGTAETEPYFLTTFTAVATEWKITLGTDYCRVVHPFQIGDQLVLDFATGAVLLNSVRAMNLLDWQNSRFFTLPPGASTLAVTPTGKSTTLVKYTPKWR